jgi:hypothetical protein
LQQFQKGGWSPLAFFSKKLSPTQEKYSTFDRELLAAHSAIRHFRFLLEGRHFRLLTDHKPLVAAMLRVSPPWSARQQRHLSFIAEFTSDIRHTSGTAPQHRCRCSQPPVAADSADLVGPLPLSSGFSYLFTVVDRTTRWPEAVPLSSVAAADCAAALLQGWIQRFGVPSTITSDRGPQFTSQLWAALCKLLSITHVQTTAYHPQANGLVERLHRRLKDALRARSAAADWHSHLPWVMLGIRTAWREDLVFSPAENVFGSQQVLPGQFLSAPESPSPSFLSDFQGLLAGRTPLPTIHNTLPSVPDSLPEDLLLSRFVLVRQDAVQPPLSPLYTGPFLVLERSLHFFKLQIGDRVDTVSSHRLKACHTPDDTTAAVPPKRGRPPAPPQPVAEAVAPHRRLVSFA